MTPPQAQDALSVHGYELIWVYDDESTPTRPQKERSTGLGSALPTFSLSGLNLKVSRRSSIATIRLRTCKGLAARLPSPT
jgi:hypothetical protein